MRTVQQLHEWVMKEMQTYTALEQVSRLGGDKLLANWYDGRREALRDVASHLVIFYKCTAVPEAEPAAKVVDAGPVAVELNALAAGAVVMESENGGDK